MDQAADGTNRIRIIGCGCISNAGDGLRHTLEGLYGTVPPPHRASNRIGTTLKDPVFELDAFPDHPGSRSMALLEHAFAEALENALKDLRHDEHFDFAIRNGIIASATIFSHVNFSRDVNPAIRIIHDPPPDDKLETLARYYARALETEFLSANLERAPLPHGLPFILDIDLDYFKGEKSIKPEDSSLFRELIRKSAVITISRERDWVRLLNMDYGNRLFSYLGGADDEQQSEQSDG